MTQVPIRVGFDFGMFILLMSAENSLTPCEHMLKVSDLGHPRICESNFLGVAEHGFVIRELWGKYLWFRTNSMMARSLTIDHVGIMTYYSAKGL